MSSDGLPPPNAEPPAPEPKLNSTQGALRAARPKPARFNGKIAALLAGGATVFVVGAIFLPSMLPKHHKNPGKNPTPSAPTAIAPIDPISYAGPGGAPAGADNYTQPAAAAAGPAGGVDCAQYPGMAGCSSVLASAQASPGGATALGAAGAPGQTGLSVPGSDTSGGARTSGLFFGGPLASAGSAVASIGDRGPAPVAPQAPTQLSGQPAPAFPARGQSGPQEVLAQNGQGEKVAFAGSTVSQDYVSGKLERPQSPYEVKAGAVIPAALITTINSDLPGEVIAQVTQPVYDHVTGKYVLIPQGSRLIGRYDSQVAYGQDRAMVVWHRVIFPNGNSINFGNMTGTDLTGAAGVADKVNDHFGQLARGIVLSTLLSMGAASAQDAQARSSGSTVINAGVSGASTEATNVGSRIADRDMNRQPTIIIRAGAQMRVLVSKDMILEPYSS